MAASKPGRCTASLKELRDGVCDVVFETIGLLWEGSRNHGFWDATGHINFGVLRARTRCRRISFSFKRSVVIETRNACGQGLNTCRQLLVGLSVANKSGRTSRLTFAQRKRVAARSQHPALPQMPTPTNGYGMETVEAFNYYLDTRPADSLKYNERTLPLTIARLKSE